jgi:hypothetical protein
VSEVRRADELPGGGFTAPAEALEALETSLGYLAAADLAEWPGPPAAAAA